MKISTLKNSLETKFEENQYIPNAEITSENQFSIKTENSILKGKKFSIKSCTAEIAGWKTKIRLDIQNFIFVKKYFISWI